jgi:hypothetical protein
MSTLYEDYLKVVTANPTYTDLRGRWQFYLQSYMGGDDYRNGAHLTRYVNETDKEYRARLFATPLDNHCRSVISVYTSFLFREQADRDLGALEMDITVEDFINDADLDGRSLDAFMKEVSIWSNVFGHCWVMLSKPNLGAITMADEQASGVRPYASLLTPLTVIDWRWVRNALGRYELDMIKYIEDVNGDVQYIKEWTKDTITTFEVNTREQKVQGELIELNGLGLVPAAVCYGNRGPIRGIGISDLSDIADQMKKIYNEYSEVEQSIRLNGHPTVVKTPDVEMSAGAGSVAQMPDTLDPGLKPYMLNVVTDIGAIYNSINQSISAIDKMANTGAIRTTESRQASGIAMRTEFELLNAKLSEKADNLELCEEQLWTLYAMYQGTTWSGSIDYPGSFNIQDTDADMARLKIAKDTATDPRVIALIDHEVVELLGEDADIVLPEIVTLTSGETVPLDTTEPFDEPEQIFNPSTGETGWVIDFDSKKQALMNGWVEA